ncbi:MAG: alpha-amylase family glycosyl hydrolase, partial [Polyangiaceae bacterium]
MPVPSTRPGWGAIPYEGGVTFRVWAPFTPGNVAVSGVFNGWSTTSTLLASEGASGTWSADVPGAAPGNEYKFIMDGSPNWRLDARSRSVTDAQGNSIVYDPRAFVWPAEQFAMPAWNQLVIYELHIGTFYDITPTAPGTFANATQKLSYLAELGINAIEVMPVHAFAGAYDEGYDVANPFAVENVYGGADAFKSFIAAAHAQGIAVILDVVYNHWGPDELTLWQYDTWSENGYGGIYFYEDWRSWTPWTTMGRPDYGRPEVQAYIQDNASMWLNEFQVDGLRWDSVAFTRNVYGNDNDPGNDLADGWKLIQSVSDSKN